MKLEVHGKGIEVTEALKNHVEKVCVKFSKMRFVREDDTMHVELKIYKEKLSKAVFTYHANAVGKVFVASAEAPDMYVAITQARDKIYAQQKKLKSGMTYDI